MSRIGELVEWKKNSFEVVKISSTDDFFSKISTCRRYTVDSRFFAFFGIARNFLSVLKCCTWVSTSMRYEKYVGEDLCADTSTCSPRRCGPEPAGMVSSSVLRHENRSLNYCGRTGISRHNSQANTTRGCLVSREYKCVYDSKWKWNRTTSVMHYDVFFLHVFI